MKNKTLKYFELIVYVFALAFTSLASSEDLGLVNLALKKAVTASSTHPTSKALYAVDGNLNTSWNAGKGAPTTIVIDLGANYTVGKVNMLTEQLPAGTTTHKLYLGDRNKSYKLVKTFQGFTSDNQWLSFEASTPFANIRYIKIETASSPSWIAWSEIQVWASSLLSCNYPWSNKPPVTDSLAISGSRAKVKVGLNKQFGGVGVQFALINNAFPDKPVDVIEARSAAGAGWQYTEFVSAYDGNEVIINQAAGNSLGSQWGLSEDFSTSSTTINPLNWTPFYQDSFNSKGVSPCVGTSGYFDLGAVTLIGQPFSIPNNGTGVKLSHKLTLQSIVNQYWQNVLPVKALYLSRHVGRDGNMRVFIQGKSGWQIGPIYPYDRWAEDDLIDQFGISHGNLIIPIQGGSWSTIWDPIDHIVLVWNIFGLDIGLVIAKPNGASLRLQENVYCTDMKDECGSIDLITFHGNEPNASYLKGATRQYTTTYYIASMQQLKAMGFYVW